MTKCTDCDGEVCKKCGFCHTANCEAEQNCGYKFQPKKNYSKGYGFLLKE